MTSKTKKVSRKTAIFIKNIKGRKGDPRLYKLSEPLDQAVFVIVSAVIAPITGPETFIFAANSKGEVRDWGELDGSFTGALDHEQALKNAGYEIIE